MKRTSNDRRFSTMRKALWAAALGCIFSVPLAAQDFHFDGSISEQVLNNYLSRSITLVNLLTDDLGKPRNDKGVDPRDNIRMLLNIKAKFVGRTIKLWGDEQNLPMYLKNAKPMAEALHKGDPEMVLQAGEFENVTPHVETLTVPKSVLAEFGQPIADRKFRYDRMLFDPGHAPPQSGTNKIIPDITKVETQMWFYFLAVSYIDAGIEAIHFGQVSLIGKEDTDYKVYYDLLARVRAYAHVHARRHFVLCDAHEPHGGIVEKGRLLFDFHSKPLRIVEVPDHPYQGVLEVGYGDSIYQKSAGGITPSGWSCEHLPYLVEFDNFGGLGGDAGKPSKRPFIWGWDEITWFGLMPEQERDAWLRYAWAWLKTNDPNGHLEMPGSRVMAPAKGSGEPTWFWANTRSPACPAGFNTEETIKQIWAADHLPAAGKVPAE